MAANIFFKNSVQGVGGVEAGGGGIGGAPYKKMGEKEKKKNSVQGVGGAVAGGGVYGGGAL